MCLARATKTRAVDKLEGAPSSLLAMAKLLQGVATLMYPVLASATGIKILIVQNLILIA